MNIRIIFTFLIPLFLSFLMFSEASTHKHYRNRKTVPKSSDEACPSDQQYYDCTPDCENRCNPPDVCSAVCKIGCFCKESLVLREDGKCVRKEFCKDNGQPRCGPDQEYYECFHRCRNSCATRNGVCADVCESGCFCKKGLVMSSQGKCVEKEECDATHFPTNPDCLLPREIGKCRAIFPRFYYNFQIGQCEKFNYGGCGGNKNNFRSKKACEKACGSVSPPPTCGPDEQYYDCVPNCHNTCDTYNRTDIGCPASCAPGCFCKEGTVKNDEGACVQISECPPSGDPQECGYDEVYYEYCAPSCTGTCRAYNNPGIYHCPRCLPGCWCKDGYFKNDDGECVPPDQCTDTNPTDVAPTNPPEFCGENEEYLDCGSACPPTCSTLGKSDFACIALCVPGCFCKEGLVRNDDGVCVEPQYCPQEVAPTNPPEFCGENEEYLDCGSACPPTCSTLGKSDFACIALCVPGCFCIEGFVRNDDGYCVEPQYCPQIPTCALPSCQDGCTLDYSSEPCPKCKCPFSAPLPTGPIEPCREDEEFLECGSACPPTCANLGKNRPCTLQCVRGCFCTKGKVRNDDGKCVEPEECPQKKCAKNEVYSICVNPCNTCEIKGKCNFLVCNKGCDCREGYYRNSRGRCIPESLCIIPESTPLPTNPDCSLPKEVGPCRARIPRFYYNSQTGQCEKFEYGGCKGNKNNFEELNECEKACGRDVSCQSV